MSWENINKDSLLVFSKPSKHFVQINFFCMSNSWSIYMCHNFPFPPRLENPFFWPHDDLFRSFLALGLAKEWKVTRCKKITNNVQLSTLPPSRSLSTIPSSWYIHHHQVERSKTPTTPMVELEKHQQSSTSSTSLSRISRTSPTSLTTLTKAVATVEEERRPRVRSSERRWSFR